MKDSTPAAAIEMHPGLPDVYRRQIEKLQEALNADENTKRHAGNILRGLIDRITIHPGEKRGEVSFEIVGDLAKIIGLADPNADKAESVVTVVAEEGLEPPTRGL